MSIDFQLQYIRQKQLEKNTKEKYEKDQRLQLYKKKENTSVQGLGFNVNPDMKEAMKQVNSFDYKPTEGEIHYRRYISGVLTDRGG
jgi:hypothetical protein